jgi:hypothetical protein
MHVEKIIAVPVAKLASTEILETKFQWRQASRTLRMLGA